MKKRLFWGLVLMQITLISAIVYRIYQQQGVLGTVSLEPIDKENINATATGTLKYFYEPIPNSHDPTTKFKDRKFSAVYTINSDALNERYDYSIGKTEDTFRIITLGASFTQGVYVDTKNNWPELLEDMLNNLSCKNYKKFEVINLGYRGYDNDYSVERYRIRGEKYRPDLIIWLQTPFLVPVEKVQTLTQQYLKKTFNAKDFAEEADKKYLKAYYDSRNEILAKMGGVNSLISYQESALLRITSYYNGPLLLMAIPIMPADEKKLLRKTVSRAENWKYFDGFRNYSVFATDWHPNKEGHKMIAEDVLNYLNESKSVSCN